MKLRDIALAVFVAFAWGSYFAVSKLTLTSFPPLLFGALRFFLIFLCTCPFFFRDKIPLKQILLLGTVTFFNLWALNYAIHLSHSLAPIILIDELTVPFSALLGMYFFKEKVTVKDLIGISIALIGLYIVIDNRSIEQVCNDAVMFTIIASALFAYYNLLVKKMSQFNSITIISQLSLVVAIQSFITSFWQEIWPHPSELELSSIIALCYSAIICGVISYYIWFYLLKKHPLSKIVPFILLVPVFGCLTTSLVLRESIEPAVLCGGIIVIIGLTIIELKNYAKNES